MNDGQAYYYDIAQIYLEIARAITNSSLVTIHRKKRDTENASREPNVQFVPAAIAIVFSYASLEAFCNSQLYSKYRVVNDAKGSDFSIVFRDIKYNKYFENEDDIKSLIEDENLKTKLKALASVCNIPALHEEKAELWQELCVIIETMRHFIIHPKPYTDDFQKNMDKIMVDYKCSQYSQTVENIVRYFHEKTRTDVPSWVQQNTLFRFLNNQDISRL